MTPQLCPLWCPTPALRSSSRKRRVSCWKTKRESRAALGYPVFPNERPVQRSRNETENYTDDDPGKQIGLLLFIHLVHRELTFLRSRRLRVFVRLFVPFGQFPEKHRASSASKGGRAKQIFCSRRGL